MKRKRRMIRARPPAVQAGARRAGAYWIAGAVLLAVQLLRVPLSQSAGWLMVADWVLALAP